MIIIVEVSFIVFVGCIVFILSRLYVKKAYQQQNELSSNNFIDNDANSAGELIVPHMEPIYATDQ